MTSPSEPDADRGSWIGDELEARYTLTDVGRVALERWKDGKRTAGHAAELLSLALLLVGAGRFDDARHVLSGLEYTADRALDLLGAA